MNLEIFIIVRLALNLKPFLNILIEKSTFYKLFRVVVFRSNVANNITKKKMNEKNNVRCSIYKVNNEIVFSLLQYI